MMGLQLSALLIASVGWMATGNCGCNAEPAEPAPKQGHRVLLAVKFHQDQQIQWKQLHQGEISAEERQAQWKALHQGEPTRQERQAQWMQLHQGEISPQELRAQWKALHQEQSNCDTPQDRQ